MLAFIMSLWLWKTPIPERTVTTQPVTPTVVQVHRLRRHVQTERVATTMPLTPVVVK